MTLQNIIKKPVNGRNHHYYHVEYINPDKATKLHKLRDIRCRDIVQDVLPHHPILGLPGVTTPQDANLNTVTISPNLYDQMADMLMIDLPETQEEYSNKGDEDKEPIDNESVSPVAVFTDPIFADLYNAMMDANGPVDLVGWQFQGRDGKWMCEDDGMELKHSALDYFMAAFLPNALKLILILTNKSLQKNEGKRLNLENFYGSLEWSY
jgi:hypothetical protein